jgi:hypothetical protein
MTALLHPHDPASVRVVHRGGAIDVVRGWLSLPEIWTMTIEVATLLLDLGAPTCLRDPL